MSDQTSEAIGIISMACISLFAFCIFKNYLDNNRPTQTTDIEHGNTHHLSGSDLETKAPDSDQDQDNEVAGPPASEDDADNTQELSKNNSTMLALISSLAETIYHSTNIINTISRSIFFAKPETFPKNNPPPQPAAV